MRQGLAGAPRSQFERGSRFVLDFLCHPEERLVRRRISTAASWRRKQIYGPRPAPLFHCATLTLSYFSSPRSSPATHLSQHFPRNHSSRRRLQHRCFKFSSRVRPPLVPSRHHSSIRRPNSTLSAIHSASPISQCGRIRLGARTGQRLRPYRFQSRHQLVLHFPRRVGTPGKYERGRKTFS